MHKLSLISLLILTSLCAHAQTVTYTFKKDVRNLVVTNPQTPENSDLEVSASTLNFGKIPIGATEVRSFRLLNKSSNTVALTKLPEIYGMDFSGATTCSAFLGSNQNCDVSVTFSPTSGGIKSGTVQLAGAGKGITVALQAEGVAPQGPAVSLSVSELAFFDIDVGATAILPITITNSGTAPLTVSSISIPPGLLYIDVSRNCLAAIAPGASCTEYVTYAPVAQSSQFSQAVSLTTNAGTNSVIVSGRAVAGLIGINRLSEAGEYFSSVPVGSTKTNSFRVSNLGNKPVSSVQVTLRDAPSSLSITSNNCPTVLGAAGGESSSCDVSVTYAPASAESFSTAKLTVLSTAQNPISNMTLSGSGVSPIPVTGQLSLPVGKKVGDTAVVISNPSSTSSGSWTYSSSPAGIVSFSGNSMSFLAAGTTTVTATQAATSTHASATVTADITVLTAPTLGAFSIPAKATNSAAFALTAPTSNSSGSWSYSSSNNSVATVSGNIVTIRGAGSTTITALQAASGAYSSGYKTATLTVTQAYGPDVVVVNGLAYSNAKSNPYYSSGAKIAVAASYCAGATIGGVAGGWRLPTVAELYAFYSAYDITTRNSMLFNAGNFASWTSDSTDGVNFYYTVAGANSAPGYLTARLYDQRQYTHTVICVR